MGRGSAKGRAQRLATAAESPIDVSGLPFGATSDDLAALDAETFRDLERRLHAASEGVADLERQLARARERRRYELERVIVAHRSGPAATLADLLKNKLALPATLRLSDIVCWTRRGRVAQLDDAAMGRMTRQTSDASYTDPSTWWYGYPRALTGETVGALITCWKDGDGFVTGHRGYSICAERTHIRMLTFAPDDESRVRGIRQRLSTSEVFISLAQVAQAAVLETKLPAPE